MECRFHHPSAYRVGRYWETGDRAIRTLTAVGNTIDIVLQLAAQHDDYGISQIVVLDAVTLAAGLDARAANVREIMLQNGERLKVSSIGRARGHLETI